MPNIGAGETYNAWYVKRTQVKLLESLQKDTLTESNGILKQLKPFRYRYLTTSEMMSQPIAGWIKGKEDSTIFTSETDIEFKKGEKILFENGNSLIIMKARPQRQHGMFLISHKVPYILELE